MNNKFKITEFAINDKQTIVPKFDEPKFSEQYNSFSMLVTHNGEDKYWSLSAINKDRVQDFANMKNNGSWKGLALSVHRENGENGRTYTKINLDDGATVQDAEDTFQKDTTNPSEKSIPLPIPKYTAVDNGYLFSNKKKELSIISQVMIKEICKGREPVEQDLDKAVDLAKKFVSKINAVSETELDSNLPY